MAHVEKYKASGVGHMLAHYRRDKSSLGRENIDPSRTHLNVTWPNPTTGVVPSWQTVADKLAEVNAQAVAEGKRCTRKDAVLMADLVVTLPEDVKPGDEHKFWIACLDYISDKVGLDNVLGGFLHRDEVRQDGSPVRDHIHIPFVPIKDGRFNYFKLCDRRFYQTLHKGLGDAVEARLGYRVSVELGEGKKAERALSQVDKADLDAARSALVAPAEEQAVRIVADAEEKAARLVEAAKRQAAETLAPVEARREELAAQIKAESARLESLQRENGLRCAIVEDMESKVADVRAYERAGRAEQLAIIDKLAAWAGGLAGAVAGKAGQLRRAIEDVRGRIGEVGDRVERARRRIEQVKAMVTEERQWRARVPDERDWQDWREPPGRSMGRAR